MKNEKKQKERATIDGIPVYCRFDEIRNVTDLVENPDNPNQHPEHQLERLAEIIAGTGWRQPVTISDLSGMVVKGHGRLRAAKLAGFKQVPVEVQHYDSKEKEVADLIADNRIAEFAEMNVNRLNELLLSLDGTPEASLTGFNASEIAGLMPDELEAPDLGDTEGMNYSQKFAVIVTCRDEQEQESIYNRLTEEGYTCKVVSV